MIKKLFRLASFLFLIGLQYTFAQTPSEERISGIFSGVSFDQFSLMVESKSSYRLFFKQTDVDTLTINVNAYESTIENLLDEIFKGSDLFYAIDDERRVFISRGNALSMELPKDFFEVKSSSASLMVNNSIQIVNKDRSFAKNRLWEIGHSNDAPGAKVAVLKGKITSFESGEPIIGALIYTTAEGAKSISDEEGNYTITLSKGRHTLIFQNFGAYQEQRQVNLRGDGVLNVAMDDNIISLNQVTVTSEKSANIERPEMGLSSITVQSLKKLPAVLG
ncbi:carboxypeptidase-like regulatory domain-containing protein, partial [uncultured Cyclobacterium sp.]|uniref:carboxypeptidase-like regulatory domain-containing protein n=1 Tax=uncultured Cyclobacterium sp. TaxID=453820 RepID=UPI0030EC698F